MCETWVWSFRFCKVLKVVVLGLQYVVLNYERRLRH